MKTLTKTSVAVMLCCSLAVSTPLLAQEDASTRTSQVNDRDDNDDESGKWGLLGLLGLLGLIGFRKKEVANRTTVTRNP